MSRKRSPFHTHTHSSDMAAPALWTRLRGGGGRGMGWMGWMGWDGVLSLHIHTHTPASAGSPPPTPNNSCPPKHDQLEHSPAPLQSPRHAARTLALPVPVGKALPVRLEGATSTGTVDTPGPPPSWAWAPSDAGNAAVLRRGAAPSGTSCIAPSPALPAPSGQLAWELLLRTAVSESAPGRCAN
jgi:hypothetical protein